MSVMKDGRDQLRLLLSGSRVHLNKVSGVYLNKVSGVHLSKVYGRWYLVNLENCFDCSVVERNWETLNQADDSRDGLAIQMLYFLPLSCPLHNS